LIGRGNDALKIYFVLIFSPEIYAMGFLQSRRLARVMRTVLPKRDPRYWNGSDMGSRGRDFMDAIDERQTMLTGQNQTEPVPLPVAAQTTLPAIPGVSGMTTQSNIWTPLSKSSGDTETYRNWGINE
jgi:hypothetical protein